MSLYFRCEHGRWDDERAASPKVMIDVKIEVKVEAGIANGSITEGHS